jgi:hypothetical protein
VQTHGSHSQHRNTSKSKLYETGGSSIRDDNPWKIRQFEKKQQFEEYGQYLKQQQQIEQ